MNYYKGCVANYIRLTLGSLQWGHPVMGVVELWVGDAHKWMHASVCDRHCMQKGSRHCTSVATIDCCNRNTHNCTPTVHHHTVNQVNS